MSDNPIALGIQVPQFDLGAQLARVAQIQHAQSQNALANFQLKEQGAEAGARDAYRANPNDISTLNGFPGLQSAAIKTQQQQEEAKNERLARDAQYVKTFAANPDQFNSAWQERLADANKRGDIPNLMHAQLAQQPPNVDMLNSVIQRGAKIPSRLDEAHAGYYEALGDARKQIAGAVQQNADTKRLKTYGDVIQRFGPNPPPQDIWDDQVRTPGSLLSIVFGGRQIPYEQAPQAWTEIKSRVAAGPDTGAQDLADLNMHPDTVAAMRRSNALAQSLGKPKVGYYWDVDPKTNQPAQKLVAEKEDKKQEMRDKSVPYFMRSLEVARQGLGQSNIVQRGMAQVPGIGNMVPATKEALELSGHAIAQLGAMVEGQRHANAQDVRLIGFFQPKWYDSSEIQSFKLTEAQKFFRAYLSDKAAGRSDEYLANRFSSRVQQAYDKLQQQKGFNPDEPDPRKPNRGQLPPSGQPDPKSLSDDELLKRLRQ